MRSEAEAGSVTWTVVGQWDGKGGGQWRPGTRPAREGRLQASGSLPPRLGRWDARVRETNHLVLEQVPAFPPFLP